jgi:protein PhnA
MARRKDEYQAQQAALNALGTALNRRSKSKCELCEERTSLKVTPIPPLEDEPSVETAIFCCHRCIPLTTSDGSLPPAHTLRFLETAAWSELRPVQLAAVRALKRLSQENIDWATDALDSLYLSPDIEADL